MPFPRPVPARVRAGMCFAICDFAARAAAAALIVAAITPAFAQSSPPSASQVTPQSLRPESARKADIALPPSAGVSAPAGAEKLFFTPARVVVDGGFDELAAETRALIKPLEHRRISVRELFAAAAAIEKAYAGAGFTLARVSVPQQHLVDGGPVRIVVVDGFIETVDTNGVASRVRDAVAARLNPIVGVRHIRQTDIERALLLAGEVAGLRLKSTLARGHEEGGTRLILEGEHRLITGTSGGDNRTSPSLGGRGANASVSLNSPLGLGEQFYVSFQSIADLWRLADTDLPLRTFGGGLVIPLDANGWTLNPEVTTTRTIPAAAAGQPSTVSDFQRYTLRTSYPVVKSRARSSTVNGEIGWVDERTSYRTFATDMRHDRFLALRLGGDVSQVLDGGQVLAAGLTVSRGLAGRSQDEALASAVPLSRVGAQPEFTKLNGDVRATQPLPDALALALTVRWQASLGDPLLQSEQFALDSTDAVSAFVPGTLSVDEGATARLELSRVISLADTGFADFTGKGSLQPYTFAAGGRGTLKQPTAVEHGVVNAATLGIGSRLTLDETPLCPETRLSFELGRQFSDLASTANDWRLTASGGVKF